jgi:hypothetical protein
MGLDTETFMCMVMVIITKSTTFNTTPTIFSSLPFMLQQSYRDRRRVRVQAWLEREREVRGPGRLDSEDCRRD